MSKFFTHRGRFLWLIATLAISATFILAACGGGTGATSSSTPTTAPATSAPTTPAATSAPTTAVTPTAVVQVKIVEQDEKYAFSPATLSVKKGTKVVWTNTSDAPHTVTSDDNAFTSSNTFSENQTFSMVFTTAGTFKYHCSIHTYMTATITVTS